MTTSGEARRLASSFRHWITRDGRPGPTGEGGFAAESNRYHLYVSLACPWAHRALIMRARKGLTNHVGLSVVHWLLDERGWSFRSGPGVISDPVINAQFLSELYHTADRQYSGRCTVPVLWDKKRATIVNNESSEIIRMFDFAFEDVAIASCDHYPDMHRAQIDFINDRVYTTLNDGVYKAGFASTQAAYEKAFEEVFETLDWLEKCLSIRRFLVGDAISEADIRLFTTLIRFDVVYFSHFKCNRRRIIDYPNLSSYLCDLYQSDGFGSTVDFNHIKRHYYESHRKINPSGIVPMGPSIAFETPRDRWRLP